LEIATDLDINGLKTAATPGCFATDGIRSGAPDCHHERMNIMNRAAISPTVQV